MMVFEAFGRDDIRGVIDIDNHIRILRDNVLMERARCAKLANAMYDLMEASHPQMAELLRQIESGEPDPA